MPKVSVILPNYNHSSYLNSRIDSILNQKFQDFELIILDDFSNDNSRELIEKYKENPKISHIVFNDKNSGSTFLQWEKGLRLAIGELIWIAESDDIAHPNFLAYHINKFSEIPNLGISFSASSWIDAQDQIIHETEHEYEFTKNGKDLLIEEFAKGNLIYNASTAVFKKQLVGLDLLKNTTQYKYCGDWLFWASMCTNCLVHRGADRLNKFRRHQGNVSFKSETAGLQFSEGFRVLNHIFSLVKIPFIKKQKILIGWILKLYKADLPKKSTFLNDLPAIAKIWYCLAPFFVFLQKIKH